ncbi:MAG TPA: hypothetical protein PK765_06815 [bacterium]|nr:hypothetical protein [bacterium]
MALSEPVRFLIFLVKDIPILIMKSPFKAFGFLFSFERFYLWDLAKILHFIVQIAAFVVIMKASQYEILSMPLNLLGIRSPFVLWLATFVLIRVAFECLLVPLAIHNKLSLIADGFKKDSDAKK